MKKITLITLLAFNLSIGQTTSIPDLNFEQALIDLGHDDVLDGSVLTTNINTLTELSISNKDISDLTGIENFQSLTLLNCGDNNLGSIDLSNNINLVELDVINSNLMSLDLSKNIELETLLSGSNPIVSLDLSKNTKLKKVFLGLTTIKILDLSKNINLVDIGCDFIEALTNLNLKNGNNLNIVSLNLRTNPKLSCVEVDNKLFMDLNWSSEKDDSTLFSENCNNTLSSKIISLDKIELSVLDKKIVSEDKNVNLKIFNMMSEEVPNKNLEGIYLLYLEDSRGNIDFRKIFIE